MPVGAVPERAATTKTIAAAGSLKRPDTVVVLLGVRAGLRAGAACLPAL